MASVRRYQVGGNATGSACACFQEHQRSGKLLTAKLQLASQFDAISMSRLMSFCLAIRSDARTDIPAQPPRGVHIL
jgi:hypothetical protein